jgi:hypothetical protein
MRMDRLTQRHDEANSRVSQFCEPAVKRSMYVLVIFLVSCLLKENALSFVFIWTK